MMQHQGFAGQRSDPGWLPIPVQRPEGGLADGHYPIRLVEGVDGYGNTLAHLTATQGPDLWVKTSVATLVPSDPVGDTS